MTGVSSSSTLGWSFCLLVGVMGATGVSSSATFGWVLSGGGLWSLQLADGCSVPEVDDDAGVPVAVVRRGERSRPLLTADCTVAIGPTSCAEGGDVEDCMGLDLS